MLKEIEGDCRSVTGKNLRNLKMISENFYSDEIDLPSKPYNDIPYDAMWRIGIAREIVEIKSGDANLDNFDLKDLDDILESVCCQ